MHKNKSMNELLLLGAYCYGAALAAQEGRWANETKAVSVVCSGVSDKLCRLRQTR
jgi:hypothetical protein